jgi:TonB family protein
MKKILVLFLILPVIGFTQIDNSVGYHPDSLDKMAEYPGGLKSLYKWLSKEIKYPKEAVKNKIEGKVYVKFTITKYGVVTDPEILNKGKNNPLLEEEALRTVKSMKKWKPAQKDGFNVKSFYTLPINFNLSKEYKESTMKK